MTLERIDPQTDTQVMKLSRLAHIKRYKKLLEHIPPGAHVLDAGCGYGYGAKILADVGIHVLAVDRAPEAIEYARRHYNSPNIKYKVMDIKDFKFTDSSPFNAVAFFEVIEHLDNPERALHVFRTVLASNGLLFLSTPNADNAVPNQFEVRNYTREDIERILAVNGFIVQEVFGQYPILGGLAGIVHKYCGYTSDTDKESGILPHIVDTVPLLPEICSGIYRNRLAIRTARTLYFMAGIHK